MAVAFDAAGAGNFRLTAGGGTSWSHTSTGSNRWVFAIVTFGLNGVAPSSHTRGCTYGGVTMTSLGAKESGSGNGGWIEMFSLQNQLTGAQTVAVTVTPADLLIIANSVSYTGVGSIGTAVTSSGTANPPTVTIPSAAGNMVTAGIGGGVAVSAPTQTQRYLQNGNTNNGITNLLIEDAAGAASVVCAATLADWWAAMGVNIIASGAAAAPKSVNRQITVAVQRAAYY